MGSQMALNHLHEQKYCHEQQSHRAGQGSDPQRATAMVERT